MKKMHLTRVLAILMMLVMALSLVACGDEESKKSDKELIVGEWEGELELAKAIELGKKSADDDAKIFLELLGDIDVSDLAVKVTAEFNDDGTFSAEISEKSMKSALEKMVERMTSDEKVVKKIMRYAIAEGYGMDPSEITDDMLEQVREEAGADSWDEVGEMLLEQIDTDDFEMKDNEIEGQYKIKGGKLYTSDDPDEEPDEDDGKDFKVTEKKLTLEIEKDGVELKVTFKRAD